MKKRLVPVVVAAAALLSTFAGAAITIYHNGTNCTIYQDGQVIYHLQCNTGQIASCSYNNGIANLQCLNTNGGGGGNY